MITAKTNVGLYVVFFFFFLWLHQRAKVQAEYP